METILVEIRAGAGGEEAAIFVKDLFKMYEKYCQSKGWRVLVLDESKSELSGFKQISFEIKGENVLEKMKLEAGVHRVQRVPKTEKNNRIHTSTVTVAVLKEPSFSEIELKPSDLKMDFYKSSGKGGQNVNKRQTAIRITHLPTGFVVNCQTERALEQNKKTALGMLQAKINQAKSETLSQEVVEARRDQIGQADRAEKIKTYNFPQNRLTDHRINKSFHNLDQIMEGKLDKALLKDSLLAGN